MGFPPIGDVLSHPQRNAVIAAYLVGIVAFISLLRPCTEPAKYNCTYDRLIADSML